MVKIIYLAAFLAYCLPQDVKSQVDSSYNTTYYQQKVSQYRMFSKNDHKKFVMFIGDSITDIAEWNELFNTTNILNRGISSDNTFGVLHRLDDVVRRKPSKVFIMIGINDIASQIADSVIIFNYKKIIQELKKALPQTQLFVQSILPTNSNFTEFQRHQNKDNHIINVNLALKAGAGKMYTYIDLYPLFLNNKGQMDVKYTNDGLHIKATGYQVWASEILKHGYLK